MSYQETADNHGIDPNDAGGVVLTAGAVQNPPILSHDASDAIGIKEGQTREDVKTKLRDALERLGSEDDEETKAQLAGQIDPELADELEAANSADNPTANDVLISSARELIKKTLRWLDVDFE